MKPVDMNKFRDLKGNCLSACIASILEIDIEKAPALPDGICDNWLEIINKQLEPMNYFLLEVGFGDDFERLAPFFGYHIICGYSERSENERHAIVGFRGVATFDPHPSRAGLTGENLTYGFLIPTLHD